MNFDELNINYELIQSKISKNGLKTQPPLDYAILKFTSSAPALDYAIIKFGRPHTPDNGAIGCAFFLITLVCKLWRYVEK